MNVKHILNPLCTLCKTICLLYPVGLAIFVPCLLRFYVAFVIYSELDLLHFLREGITTDIKYVVSIF